MSKTTRTLVAVLAASSLILFMDHLAQAQEAPTEGSPEASSAQPATPPAPAEQPLSVLGEALLELEQNNLEAAITILEQAERTEEADPREAALLGAIYVEVGRHEEALAILEPLAEQDNADLAVLYNAGRAAAALEKYDQAESYLEPTAKALPDSPASRELGFVHFRQGRVMQAYLRLRPWSRNLPGDAEAAKAAATCAVQLGRGTEAEQLLRLLPTEQPDVKLLWANALLLKNDPWSALAVAKELALKPREGLEPQVLTLLADIYLELDQPDLVVEALTGKTERRPVVAVRLARALRQLDRLDEAFELLTPFSRGLVDDDPTVGRWLPGLGAEVALEYGRLLAAADRHPEAVKFLRASTDLERQDAEAWRALATSLDEVGEIPAAREARGRAERIDRLSGVDPAEASGPSSVPDPTGRQLRRAQALLDSGAEAEALRIARQEKVLVPGDPRPLLLEAQMLTRLGRSEEALDVMDVAQASFATNADVNYYRGVVQMTLKQFGAAELSLNQAIAIAPEHTPALTDLAVLLIQLERPEEAKERLQKVLAIRPGDAVAADLLEELQSP